MSQDVGAILPQQLNRPGRVIDYLTRPMYPSPKKRRRDTLRGIASFVPFLSGELAKAEQTSRLVQKFDLVGTGITILKYKVLAELMSNPVSAKTLKELTPDGITPNNLKILQTALIGLERELVDSVTGYNRNEDQGIVNEYEINKKSTDRAPITDSTVVDSNVREIPLANVQPNAASRLSTAGVINPVGMQGTPTTDRNLLARGQQLFSGPGEITFASKGGIMNSKKAFQRVA